MAALAFIFSSTLIIGILRTFELRATGSSKYPVPKGRSRPIRKQFSLKRARRSRYPQSKIRARMEESKFTMRRPLLAQLSWRRLLLVSIILTTEILSSNAFVQKPPLHQRTTLYANMLPEESFNVRVNEFFKQAVPLPVLEKLSVHREMMPGSQLKSDVISRLTASPGDPGVPRPLWLVILGSVPTGLLWYGYYKFCIEEELFEMELAKGMTPRGFGGFGTLGPFVYGCLLGPLAFIFHLPGGLQWTNLGIIFIYYTQFLLYDRVNELYREQGEEAPLTRKSSRQCPNE